MAELAFALLTELRASGTPVGLREGLALLRLARTGAPLAGPTYLRRLAAHVLRVEQTADGLSAFEQAFERALREVRLRSRSVDLSSAIAPEPETPPLEATERDQPPPPRERLNAPLQPSPEHAPPQALPQRRRPAFERDQGRALEIRLESPPALAEPVYAPIAPQISDEYYPLTRRDLTQAWRLLANRAQLGPRDELDLDATVRRLAGQGVLDEPVIRRRRINRMALLLLIDRSRSMAPFRELGERIVETALRGSDLAAVRVLYFANYPDRLYQDRPMSQPLSARTAIAALRAGPGYANEVAALIFGDAGAARGHYNAGRAWITNEAVRGLRAANVAVAWLNPMPTERWAGTSADTLDVKLAPMLSFNREGLLGAMAVLKGGHRRGRADVQP